MQEKNLPPIDIHTVFFYLTERCNLGCSYCYFRHKNGRDLPLNLVEPFLSSFYPRIHSLRKFEISGGEPLLRWPELKALTRLLQKRFPVKTIALQTNGLLLFGDRISFLRDHGVGVQIGIDGTRPVTLRWRKRMGPGGFSRLTDNIRQCVKAGLGVTATMTVHPQEAQGIVENFYFLRSLGIRDIDMTPAAFMPWDEDSIRVFKERYAFLMSHIKKRGEIYVREDWQVSSRTFLDLSLHPPGYVLCGDPYLCLPVAQRREYSLWDPKAQKVRLEVMKFFIKAYEKCRRELKGRAYTYRDHVNSGFKIVNALVGREYLNVSEMVSLMRFLTRTHLMKR
jgi:sulfatase maturation enzyme AslB (radical SAM superfamily)